MACLWKAILCLIIPSLAERLGQFQNAESRSGGFANLKVKRIEKVKVEAISKAEAIRMRQSGLRFHEVEHHHFNDHRSRNSKLWKDLKDAKAEGAEDGFPWKKKSKGVSTTEKPKATSDEEDVVTTNSSLDESLTKALMPKKKIQPQRIGGFLCAQFDLDLAVLSGGAFPGMFGVGFLGDIHYQSGSKCYGSTSEVYVMLSIGVGLWGMDFRVALVFIFTMVVTERPLSAGAKDLVWELPPGFDTKHCMESNPFKLVTAPLKEGWKFIYHHVLKKKYLKHAEAEVQKYLQDNKHEMSDFGRYVDFIEPPQALPEIIKSPTQSRGLASTGIVASVQIKGRWLEGFIELEVQMPKNQRVTSRGVSANIFEFASEVRAKIWQDLGKVILSQKSELCEYPKYKQHRCKFRLRARREAMAYVQLSFRTFDDFVAPIQIDTNDVDFSFPASVRASREPPAGTLSCQTVDLKVKPSEGVDAKNCRQVEAVKMEVKVGNNFATAVWNKDQFGEGDPWGMSISKNGMQGDHREIDEIFAEKVANIRLYELDNTAVTHFLSSLMQAKKGWCPTQDSFRKKLFQSLAKPSTSTAKALHTETLIRLIQPMVAHFQQHFIKQMKEQVQHVLVPQEVSKAVEVPESAERAVRELVSRLPDSDKECAKRAVQKTHSDDDPKSAWLSELLACGSTALTKAAINDVMKTPAGLFKVPSGGPKTWKTFDRRTVNTRSCTEQGFVSAESAERCRQSCDEEVSRSESQCNTVVFDSAGDEMGWCTFWFCNSWDVFPRDDDKILSIKLDEQRLPTNLELLVAAPRMAVESLVRRIPRAALEVLVDDLLIDERSSEIWTTEIREIWKNDALWPSSYVLADGIYRPLLAECLLEDGSWVQPAQTMNLLRGLHATGLDHGVKMTLTTVKGNVKDRSSNSFSFKNDFKGPSRKWLESVTFLGGGCQVTIDTQWIWQAPGSSAYFVRPNLVPVVQGFFASYDQFVSKLPAYSDQALQRILRKNSSRWKISVLPYKTTDGRHLHRHLKRGDHDRVKVFKGEVATDDVVYNFPRAMAESKHRDEANFLYNTGLSVANLFLRVVSDVQAMFNIYFANHPDWDQSCESLPARFDLLYESEKVRPTSNWKTLAWRKFTSKEGKELKITHRAKDKVSQRGEELSKDDLAMIEDWHWVGKPRWFFGKQTRAEFFFQTPPVHGKDGWATADVSDLSAAMWPHMWCELVEQEWNSMSTEMPTAPAAGDSQANDWMTSLEQLYRKIPEEVTPLMEEFALDRLGEFLVEMLPGFSEVGCPQRMRKKEPTAVDLSTYVLLSAWDTSLSVMQNSLTFYQTLVEQLVQKEEEVHTSSGEDDDTENSTDAAPPVPPSDKQYQVTRTSQLDTVMDTLRLAGEKWRTHGVMGQGLRDSLKLSWDALFKNLTDADSSATVEARRSFQESRDALEALVAAQKVRMSEIGDHLENLFTAEPEAEIPAERAALQYVKVLVAAAAQRQEEVLRHFTRISSCIDSISKPKRLDNSVFGWTEGFDAKGAPQRMDLKDLRNKFYFEKLNTGKGLDLFFEKACLVSPQTDFTIPVEERLVVNSLSEPRSECERVVLSNAFLAMFPNFAASTTYTFFHFMVKLADLQEAPTKGRVEDLLQFLESYLRKLKQGAKAFHMDDDFYKAFGYRKDGSLFGHLWSNLPSALTEIAATLQMRKDTRTQWITESIAFRSKLQKARRMRVRELENEKKIIATEVEGCICHEQWTGYVWRKLRPKLMRFTGCMSNINDGSLMFVKNSSSWKGFCKTKRDPFSAVTTSCKKKYAECDPQAGSAKPKFQIWRSADVLRADPVRLPLLQLDLYVHVDLRNRRADFCTPNFAPLMLDTNWHWSMSNWLPYDLRRSACFGARVHPPGFSLQMTMCRHKALGSIGASKHLTTEWSVTGVAYLVSHYNVWGTGDGDMTRTWFGGGENWGTAAANQGWPNFLMADPGTWASSSAGSGYLSTQSVAASPSAFWFSLLAEVISVFAMGEMFAGENATVTHTAKSAVTAAVVVVWRLLQKYAVVPNNWGAFMGTSAILKAMGAKGLMKLTGLRNEHDVVLSVKYSIQMSKRKLDLTSLINDMSMDQLRELFFSAKRWGAPVDDMWMQHTSTAAGAPTVVRNVHREMLEDLARSYILNVKKSSKETEFLSTSSQKQLQDLFRSCDGRPLWYKVVGRRRPLYTFWKRERSAWTEPKLPIGTILMVSKYDDDWYTVIDDPHRETHYIPARYLQTADLKLQADVLVTQGQSQIESHPLLDFEIEQILKQVSVETLDCWGIHISRARPEMFQRIMKEANRLEKSKIPSLFDEDGKMLEGTEVPLGYFSLAYVRSFMTDNFGRFLEYMNTTQQANFLSIFKRGKKSRVSFHPRKESWLRRGVNFLKRKLLGDTSTSKSSGLFKPELQREVLTSKTSYIDVGLSILTRLGLSFIKLPGVFQLQPYIQLSVQYDVKQIFQMFKAKVKTKGTSDSLQQYLRRKAACEKCIDMQMAFCDRQEAADAMLKNGHTPEMDACEPMDLENKEMCHRFSLPKASFLFHSLAGDGLFKSEICPCYRPVSGMQIVPRWITQKESCGDISWPDAEVEALKRASKDRDWTSGFSMQSDNERYTLDQINEINSDPPQRQGCLEGYRCCGVLPTKDAKKPSKVRCVEKKSLYKKSTWMHPSSKCKYFKPPDASDSWSHTEHHCKEDAVDGYWSWNEARKWWQEDSIGSNDPVEEPSASSVVATDLPDETDETEGDEDENDDLL